LRRRHKGDKIGLSPPNSIMATIKARRQANGSIRYTAIVRRRVGKTIVHREAKTFVHRSAAVSSARHREVSLDAILRLVRTGQLPARGGPLGTGGCIHTKAATQVRAWSALLVVLTSL
jgi:hypothetical protein